MMSTKIPLPLSAVLSSFLEFSVIPNLFEYALEGKLENEPEPYKEAFDFGFETSTFLMNGGEMLCSTLVMMTILPIAILLRKCRHHRVAGYFHDVVTGYKWSFFIRAWIEIYLEVLVAAYLQVLHPSLETLVGLMNTTLGYIFFINL